MAVSALVAALLPGPLPGRSDPAMVQAPGGRAPAGGLPLPAGWRSFRLEPEQQPGQPKRGPEVLLLPSAGTALTCDAAIGVVILPGNPGVPQLYCRFGSCLQRALRDAGAGEAAVYVLGYSNFATEGVPDGVVPIEAEAAMLGPILEELAASHSQSGIMLIGHSIGAWCMLEHLGPNGCLRAARVMMAVLATPYLEFDATRGSSQRFYRWVLNLAIGPALVRFIARLVTLIPLWLQELLVPRLAGVDAGSYDFQVVLGTFGRWPHFLEGTALMGKTEFSLLQPGRSSGFASLGLLLEEQRRPNLMTVYADRDPWFPQDHARRLEKLFGAVTRTPAAAFAEVHQLGDVPHAFVLSAKHCDQVAEIIARRLAYAIGERQGGNTK